MLSINQAKFINSLKLKKFRQKYQSFVVEGEKNVSELIKSEIVTLKVFGVSEYLLRNQKLLEGGDFEIHEITNEELRKISDLVTPNMVLAIAAIPTCQINETYETGTILLALDGIRDPGNMGTIIRTADWFGIRKIICSTDSVDMYNPKVIQATMGSFSRTRLEYVDLNEFFSKLDKNIPVYGALLDGEDITLKNFTRHGIILIGSESHGVSESVRKFINEPVLIPNYSMLSADNQAESLNASVANGIICYEICKQLSKKYF